MTPDLFRLSAIAPEVAAQIEQIEKRIAEAPLITERNPQDLREERARGGGTFPKPPTSPRARERRIKGPAGEITLRCFEPAIIDGVYLHIHGGGWTLGSADGQDPLLERIADNAYVAVVSLDYRLAPEHPYPAAPDDCEAAALWLARQARAEFGTDRLLIGGESAGAHLAAVTLARLRDRHGLTPFRGANLVYGMYDLGGTPSVRNWGERNLVLSTPIIAWLVGNYLPPDLISVERLKHPDISPLYANLKDLPPALFTCGTLDPLIDDTLFLHARFIAAGIEAELALYPGGVHGFNAFPGALANAANTRIERFLRDTGIKAPAPQAGAEPAAAAP